MHEGVNEGLFATQRCRPRPGSPTRRAADMSRQSAELDLQAAKPAARTYAIRIIYIMELNRLDVLLRRSLLTIVSDCRLAPCGSSELHTAKRSFESVDVRPSAGRADHHARGQPGPRPLPQVTSAQVTSSWRSWPAFRHRGRRGQERARGRCRAASGGNSPDSRRSGSSITSMRNGAKPHRR